ncbi:MAG: bifunctional enoyl-CoA hydratase/phosphate acetyltransferase [Steroidobacteraceae bacterium]
MPYSENHTYDELKIGTSAKTTRRVTTEDVQLLAVMAGNGNAVLEHSAADQTTDEHQVQDIWSSVLIFSLLSNDYPGFGTNYIKQTLDVLQPIYLDDVLTATVTVLEKHDHTRHVLFECRCVNQDDAVLLTGTIEVRAPAEKIRRLKTESLQVQLIDHNVRYQRLISLAHGLAPIRVAVAHPCDPASLHGAVEAALAGLILPVLIGPAGKVVAAATSVGLDIKPYSLVDVPHSHAAATLAVAMARRGEVDAIMKGSLHTDELMTAVIAADTGLRTDRRMSHVFAMDVPSYSHPLLITDAAINIAPDLNDKRDIVQNAIDLAHVLGISEPRVAILAAVETITDRLRSTLDAAALCKMAERGQITGGILDGPLAFDNAVSPSAAETKHLHSKVAGNADILVVPDLESGNMLAKQLQYLAHAQSAGIVLGARVPIVLTSRADPSHARIASSAMALLIVRKKSAGKLEGSVSGSTC